MWLSLSFLSLFTLTNFNHNIKNNFNNWHMKPSDSDLSPVFHDPHLF